MKILPLLLMLCLMVVPAQAALDQPLADPVLEARAVAIGNQLRCAVCQSESINDSQAEFARDMRKLVREKIAAGWSDRKIIDYIRTRYGDFILLQPPFQANTWLLWLFPALCLTGAGLFLAIFFRRKKSSA